MAGMNLDGPWGHKERRNKKPRPRKPQNPHLHPPEIERGYVTTTLGLSPRDRSHAERIVSVLMLRYARSKVQRGEGKRKTRTARFFPATEADEHFFIEVGSKGLPPGHILKELGRSMRPSQFVQIQLDRVWPRDGYE